MKILLNQAKKCFYEIFKLLYDETLNFQIRKLNDFQKTDLKNFQKGKRLEGEKLL